MTDKATISPAFEAVTTALKEYAVLLEGIPNVLLDAISTFRTFANGELTYAVRQAIDAAVVDSVFAASPVGATGTDYVSQVRAAVATMRSVEGNPKFLACRRRSAPTSTWR